MNKYDQYFDFRIATIDDVNLIMSFLKTEWGEKHILANNKDLFLWQYGNQSNENINFVLMLDKEGNIVGINGFIPYADEVEKRYVSSAITKVKNNLNLPMCGVELIRRFKNLVPAVAYYSSGTNPNTMIPIGKKIFHYSVGIMKHYYKVNPNIEVYNIAEIKEKPIVVSNFKETDLRLIQINEYSKLSKVWDFEKRFPCQSYKSFNYIKHRFFEHPIYRYKVFGIWNDLGDCKGIIIGREICINGSRILRIVDFLGDLVYTSLIGKQLDEMIKSEEYEYIDFMVSYSPQNYLEEGGFVLRKNNDFNVIPMYFEPFVKENIDTWYQTSDKDIVIYKADGDQDRPNMNNNNE